MSVEEDIKIIRNNHSKAIILVKIGAFYHTYTQDAYIISYLFGYQLKKQQNVANCGFTATVLENVIERLESTRINYVVVDKYFKEVRKRDFENLNMYDNLCEISKKYAVKKNKIEEINRFLLENIDNKEILNIISQIEKIIYDF